MGYCGSGCEHGKHCIYTEVFDLRHTPQERQAMYVQHDRALVSALSTFPYFKIVVSKGLMEKVLSV